ncbi:MAG: hypothetical protein EBR90_01845 [Actinobacteria bacterium]|nr:hypothetical protein [Actinomycetota bacterium]
MELGFGSEKKNILKRAMIKLHVLSNNDEVIDLDKVKLNLDGELLTESSAEKIGKALADQAWNIRNK